MYLCVHVESHIHVAYVTWAGGICWMCMHKPEGVKCPGVSVDIRIR